jgi:hypothetical protein
LHSSVVAVHYLRLFGSVERCPFGLTVVVC